MYRHLQNSFADLKDKQDLAEEDVNFPGWDGHRNELSFARDFCFRQSVYEGIYEAKDATDIEPDRYDMIRPSPAYDSHFPTMDMYRRMLDAYPPRGVVGGSLI